MVLWRSEGCRSWKLEDGRWKLEVGIKAIGSSILGIEALGIEELNFPLEENKANG